MNHFLSRRCSQNICTEQDSGPSPNVLNNIFGTKFWINFANGNIAIGLGWIGGANTIVSFTDPSPFPVNVVRIASEYDNSVMVFPTRMLPKPFAKYIQYRAR